MVNLFENSFPYTQPKIADFGLLKPIKEGKTHISTRVAGTIGYMDPEYREGAKVTAKSDIYR